MLRKLFGTAFWKRVINALVLGVATKGDIEEYVSADDA